MRLLDDRGRLFGLVNVIDLALVLLVSLVVVTGYLRLTAPGRWAEPYPLPDEQVHADTVLRVPADRAWIARYIEPGLAQRDARSGKALAEVTGMSHREDGQLDVRLRLRAARDADGTLLYDGTRLAPGRGLKIDTPACTIEGTVAAVDAPD